MPNPFHTATAEQLINVIEAVTLKSKPTDIQFVENFCDISHSIATSALDLAVDLGFLKENSSMYETNSFLCNLLITPSDRQKAAILRLQLESYNPFICFRERLKNTHSLEEAARNVKNLFDLDENWQGVKDTLISLGTYSNTIQSKGSGVYTPSIESYETYLYLAIAGCQELTNAEQTVRELIGDSCCASLSYTEMIKPLSRAMVYASKKEQSRNVILHAGNAIDDFLNYYGNQVNLNVSSKTGINAKIDFLKQNKKLPKKLAAIGNYLGHIRNAADHGTDPETQHQWIIRSQTSVEYVFIACTFIKDCLTLNRGQYEL
jgi:hypothetical protein